MNVAPEASREVIVGHSRRVNLVRLAKAQRLLLRLVVGLIGVYLAFIILPGRFRSSSSTDIAVGLTGILFLLVSIAITVQTVRLALAAGSTPAMAVIGGLLMLLPLVGLILMALANGRANSILRKNGAKVGFLGVTQAEMIKLTQGYCHNCGYPMQGLPSPICPECGKPLPPA